MVFWPFYGAIRRLTEKEAVYTTPFPVRALGRQFRRSMHVFVIDSGCDNILNFNVAALSAPQYNTHRFGIFFADTPRHADLLIVLGPPLTSLRAAVSATVAQMPEPFGILLIGGIPEPLPAPHSVQTPARVQQLGPFQELVDPVRVAGFLPGVPGPSDILAALLAIQRGASA